jgi:hypothetical protein
VSHVLTEPRREHGRVEAPESQVHIDSPVDADASAGWRRARPRRIHALSVVVLLVGTVLGMIEPTITTSSYELAPGDTLVLFTDGLTDAPRRSAVTLDEVQRAHAAAPGRTPDDRSSASSNHDDRWAAATTPRCSSCASTADDTTSHPPPRAIRNAAAENEEPPLPASQGAGSGRATGG